MNNSVILQVDESTKGLMEEIQSGLSSSIENGMREVKDKVESVDDTAEMILRKFKNFDGLSSTVEQLRSLAEESKKFTAVVSPLENSVSELKQGNKSLEEALAQIKSNIDLLVKGVVELSEKENSFASEIKVEIQAVQEILEKNNENASTLFNNILDKLSKAESERKDVSGEIKASLSSVNDSISCLSNQLKDKTSQIEEKIETVGQLHKDFANNYSKNEDSHNAFENKTSSQLEDMQKTMEKIQTTLDIIVNLTTPFWKKW